MTPQNTKIMKTTINEKKAKRYILISFIINYFSLAIFGLSVRNPNIILGVLCITGYFVSLMILGYNCYSLGWEFKRISMEEEDDTKE